MLTVSHGVILLAGFFAPYSFDAQDREHVFAPPTPLHFSDANGWHLRPFVYQFHARTDSFGQYDEDRSVPFAVKFLVDGHLFGTEGNARICLLGTDALGRDEFSRLLYGGRISLFAGILATLISVLLGMALGGTAGYLGGWIDSVIMRLTEVFLSVPWLYLLLSVRAMLPLDIDAQGLFLLLAGALGVIGWSRPARLVRGVVLSAKTRDYVLAAKGFGASPFYILRTHVLPAASEVIATQAALYIPQYVLAEVTLSFVGLGVNEPVPSWGNMLTQLQQYFILQACWWMFAPALALIIVFLAYQQLFSETRTKQQGV